MGFRTKIDFSNNRQAKQRIETITVLSGGTSFGVPFNLLPTGADLSTAVPFESYTGIVSQFSGDGISNIFTWGDPRMSLAEPFVTPITPSNSGESQTLNSYSAITSTVIDGNTVNLTYTGVSFDIFVSYFEDLGGGNYSGEVTSNNFNVSTANGLDFTGRTIWNDVSGITRTDRLIVSNNPQLNYVLTCIDTEGMASWSPPTIFTGNTSATCITDIYVTNLYGCSPLHIDPTGLNDVYIVENGGNVGIGTTSPTSKLHVSGNTFIDGNVDIIGNVNIVGSATTINTQTVQSKDNKILLNYSGNNLTAIGGGLEVLSAKTNGNSVELITDVNGDWNSNTGLNITGRTDDNTSYGLTIKNSGGTDTFVVRNDGNVGIGTSTPSYLLNIVSGTSEFYYDPQSLGGRVQILGDDMPRFDVGKVGVAGASYGIVVSTNPILASYGQYTDTYLYASASSNGLNLINASSGGLSEDYIRFYAGIQANSTSHMHIQGSGSTNGYIGMGTENPTEKLHVSGNTKISGGLIIESIGSGTSLINLGLDSSGNVVTGTTGSTTYWSASTGVDAIVVKNSNSLASGILALAEGSGTTAIGDYSHSEGNATKATGNTSHAEGYLTTAGGDNSHAEGNQTKAIGVNSHAEGQNTTASGNFGSHAEGIDTTASGGFGSHAEGFTTTAIGTGSHAEGSNTRATSVSSHAEGDSTTASGFYSHAEGEDTKAIGQSSHSEGYLTTAGGVNSHAEGNQASAVGNHSHAEGYGSTAIGFDSHAEGGYSALGLPLGRGGTAIGIGSHAEGNQASAVGNHSHAEGAQTTASGYASHAEGRLTTSIGQHSHAEGYLTTAILDYSHSEGISTVSGGLFGSHAEGNGSVASGQSSHAEGAYSTAIGNWSHSEGRYTTASGTSSHAEGWFTVARDYSHSEGFITTALGNTSHAEGYLTTAIGQYSHAEGYFTIASGESSHTEGFGTNALTFYSHAEGYLTYAYGVSSHAEGQQTTARANYSHSEGWFTIASGISSHAEGFYSTAIGNGSHAEGGYDNGILIMSGGTAVGIGSHAEGVRTTSVGVASHAEGSGTTAIGDYSHAEGFQTIASGTNSHAEGNITTASAVASHAEGNQTTASGLYSHAEGQGTIASGQSAHAEGRNSKAFSYPSHAEGNTTTAIGSGSHSEGELTIASGDASHAEGSLTTAIGIRSHSEGRQTTASGSASHAEGELTIAIGLRSHAEGYDTTAQGDDSHAEGNTTIAIGLRSHSEGYNTTAQGDDSHAEGYSTTAVGLRSHAEGYLTIVSGDNSHAEGYLTTAIGGNSHAEGDSTTAFGAYSHAGGLLTVASGQTSFVHGNNSIAGGDSTIVLGNNITGTSNNSVYVSDLYITNLPSTDPLATNASGKVIAGVSDVRLKENVKNIGSVLNLVNKLRPVSFTYKQEIDLGTDTHFGLIAQEVQSLFPELVKKRNTYEDYLNVSYVELIPILINAINELSTGTTTTQGNAYLETQTILAEDNNIDLNYNGTPQTALGGGIRVLHAKGQDMPSELITDENGDFFTNTDFKPNSLTIPYYTPVSSSDSFGSEGNITRDDDYLYLKCSNKWKRIKLEEF